MTMNANSLTWSICVFCAVLMIGIVQISGRGDIASGAHGIQDTVKIVGVSHADGEDFVTSLPPGAAILLDQPNARGWQQTGRLPMDLEGARGVVVGMMCERGYALMQEVGDSESDRWLSEWRNDGNERIMWSLWLEGRHQTGFSWGNVK